MNYLRCQRCEQLIDPIEEYHIHQGRKYYGE